MRALFGSVVACILLLATAAAADAAYSTISGPGESAGAPRLAVAANGAAIVAWQAPGPKIKVRYRAPDGTFSRVQTVRTLGAARDPQVAIEPDGDAFIQWLADNSSGQAIYGRTRAASGALGPVEKISRESMSGEPWHGVGMADNGTATLAYQERGPDGDVRWRRRSPDGTLSRRDGSTIIHQRNFDHQLVVGRNGSAVLAHIIQPLPTSKRVLYIKRPTVGNTLPRTRVSTNTVPTVHEHEADVDANGNAVVAWREMQGTTSRLMARTQAADGTLGSPHTLAASGAVGAPQVAVADNGAGLVAWRAQVGEHARLRTRPMSTGGVLGAQRTLTAGYDVTDADGAADAVGNVTLVWQRTTGATGWIFTRGQSPAGVLSPIRPLSPSATPSRLPVVGAPATLPGALAVWLNRQGTFDRVQASPAP